jgi:glycerol uptake facilitator protein
MFSRWQRASAEVVGTAALVLVGPGTVVATVKLAGNAAPLTGGNFLGIAFAFGLIISVLVYALGKVSGCHINPAVTFALAATRRFPWREVPIYWAAQYAGAVIGALGIWAIFGTLGAAIGLGQTAFSGDTSYAAAAAAELIGTGLLMFAILGIVDRRSPGELAGLVIGSAIVALIMVMGPVTGGSLNPARAFGPELVTAIAGGPTHWVQYLPVYFLPGLAGSVMAAFIYDFLAEPRIVELPIGAAVTHPDPDASPPSRL